MYVWMPLLPPSSLLVLRVVVAGGCSGWLLQVGCCGLALQVGVVGWRGCRRLWVATAPGDSCSRQGVAVRRVGDEVGDDGASW